MKQGQQITVNVQYFRPLHDRVLVRVIGKAFTTAELRPRANSRVILIRSEGNLVDGVEGDYRRMPLLGEILAVGPGKYDEKDRFQATTVKPGEVVVFTDWNDWEDAPAGVHMIREGDVWGYPNEARSVHGTGATTSERSQSSVTKRAKSKAS